MDDEIEIHAVRVPKGTHLSKSRATPGMNRQLLRKDDTNENLGPPESFPLTQADLDDLTQRRAGPPPSYQPTPYKDFAAETLHDFVRDVFARIDWDQVYEQFLEPAAIAGADRLRAGWRRRGNKAARKVTAGAPAGNAERKPGDDDRNVTVPPASENSAPVAVTELRMSGDEFRARLAGMLVADEFAKEQREILLNAVIDDQDVSAELATTLIALIERDEASLDQDGMAAVTQFLFGLRVTAGKRSLPAAAEPVEGTTTDG